MAFQGASSSSRSSSTRWSTYDVFLSFRGEDTRQHFTAHLRHALDRKNIYTYIDYNLPRGEEISDKLLKAIESSRISIVVLSKNYASSRWCLDELMKILECKKTKQQKVLPVFYDVDPTEVRNQREVFGKALAELKERFKDESKVKRWKAALTEVAGLSGFPLRERTEAELIQEIVRDVSKLVKPKYLNNVAEHPVGMESRVQDVHDILDLRVGVNDTRILGIYGTGGIGKTTLAKAIYNTFTDQFENCCFLANVREKSKSEDGLIKLQETLLFEILGDWSLKVTNVDEGMGLIKKMLWSKKVLLVLDDLDKSVKVKTLLGGCDHLFRLGSIIIITTRDEHLLTINNVHLRYKVKELDRDEALRLFCLYAFKKENPNHDFAEITENVLDYVGGLPLALTVIGSDLCGRDIHYWRSALEKYKRIPHKDIFEMLKISYDGLDESEKNIFLDIACFFTGKHKTYVTEVLDGCGFFATCGIKVLVDKSLITIDERLVRMHDLLKDMGREIVRQESPKEPEKRSRLWFHEDVRGVLEETKGTNTIEAILLDFPIGHDKICLHSKAFKKMKNLRLFINRNAQFSAVPNYLPNEIRVFDWPEYPWSFLPSNFHGTKLIEFRMRYSLIKELGGLKSKNLTVMNLIGCEFLTKIPDLSSSPNLEKLDLEDCENLVEIHDSVGFLDKLWGFSVDGCCKLRIFPKRFKLRSLRIFYFENCWSLEDFPEIECEMEFLHVLDFRRTSIKELPSSIGNLTGLQKLYARIDQLPSLRIGKVEEDGIQSTPSIVSTGEECEIASTTTELSIFNSRERWMAYSSSANWKSLQFLTLQCKNLTVMDLSGCKSLTRIRDLSSCPNLHRLDLSYCDQNLVEVYDSLRFLKMLSIWGTETIEFRMPNSLITFKNLTAMNLSGCKFLTKIPDLSSCPNLRRLDLSNCENLVEVHDSVGFLEKLWSFSAFGCCKLRILPKRFKLRSLRFLDLRFCSSLEDFPEIECEMEFLHELDFRGTSIKELPSSIGNLTRLQELYALKDCDLPSSIFQLQSLRIFKVDGDSQVPIHIGKVEEDGIQSTPSVNDAGSSSSTIWKSLEALTLRFCCLSESNFFTNGNYFPALDKLDLSGSDKQWNEFFQLLKD